MIANGNHGENRPPEKNGGQGGPEHFHDGPGQTSDTRMIEQAVKRRWPIPEKFKEAIVRRQVRIATSKNSSNREASAAARCVLEMERQNQADEHKRLDKEVPDQHAHSINITDVNELRRQLLDDSEYLDYQRGRAVSADAGAVCPNGKPRPLEDGSASETA